ncbi:glycosyltransferase family 2 protein [Inquilinus sp. KBS0705]|nr:glycosyltransferase family 2 protein [Inquilinus sp. KBS0705]
MMSTKKLAIVIPAYKDTYLEATLNSILSQTDNRFTVFIGDDASPFDLYSIVSKFENKIDINYVRFKENLGAKNLVAHWERCIDLCNEDWIWLFSDDDIMDATCVESFYIEVESHPEEALFHFDVEIIDKNGKTISYLPFSKQLNAEIFFWGKVTRQLSSFVVEYIFKRTLYIEKGGFEEFDLAWGSDDATWIKFMGNKPVYTIFGCKVYWRFSSSNISSNNGDKSFVERKIKANLQYLSWIDRYFKDNDLIDITTKLDKLRWMIESIKYTNIGLGKKIQVMKSASNGINAGRYYTLFGAIYLILFTLKTYTKGFTLFKK